MEREKNISAVIIGLLLAMMMPNVNASETTRSQLQASPSYESKIPNPFLAERAFKKFFALAFLRFSKRSYKNQQQECQLMAIDGPNADQHLNKKTPVDSFVRYIKEIARQCIALIMKVTKNEPIAALQKKYRNKVLSMELTPTGNSDKLKQFINNGEIKYGGQAFIRTINIKDTSLQFLLRLALCVFLLWNTAIGSLLASIFVIFIMLVPEVICVPAIAFYTNYSQAGFKTLYKVAIDYDGDYVAVGYINYVLSFMRVSKNGALLCYNDAGASSDFYLSYGVDITSSKLYLVAAYSRYGQNSYILKLDSACAIIWNRRIDELNPNYMNAIKIIDDNFAVVVGAKSNAPFILKFNYNTGSDVNTWTFSSTCYGHFDGVKFNKAGELVIVGAQNNLANSMNCVIMKFDTNIYNTFFGSYGTLEKLEACKGISETLDNGYISIGYTDGCTSLYCIYTVKIDSSGVQAWTWSQKTGTYYDYGEHVEVLSDGTNMFVGSVMIANSSECSYLGFLSSNGQLLWSTYLCNLIYRSLVQASDGSIIGAGSLYSSSNYYFLISYISLNNCTAGNYANGYYSSTCNPCGVGKYQNYDFQTSCINCSAGSYTNLIGQTSCSLCPVGSSSIAGQTSCTICPAGTNQSVSGGAPCANCSAGYYQDQTASTTCKICPAGSSSIAGQVSCTLCPIGTSQSSEGSSSCVNCPAGYFSNSTGSTSCTICPARTYQTQAGQSTCISCSEGTFGSSPPGQTSNPCQNCTVGYYNNLTAQASCLPCPIGYYASSAGTITCTQAPIGSYVALTAQSTYQPCAAGTFQDQKAQSSCNPCISSQYSSAGASTCLNCTSGWYPPLNRDKCLFKGIFNSQTDFNNCNFSTLCFTSSTLIKPFTQACRSAFVPLCCDGNVAKTTVQCNFGLELQPTDILYNRFCNPCAFTTLSACPPDNICWNDVTNNLHTDFSLTCLEYIAPYCGSRLMLNPNDTECLIFTNSCNSVVVSSAYGNEFTKFKITFSRMLPSTLPSCRTIFDLTKTPILNTGSFTCTRTSDYIIDVDISVLSSPISSFYFANSVLKDACGVYLPSTSAINILPPNNQEVIQITGSTTDKCLGLLINSTITKGYLWPISTQSWSVSYTDTAGIPNENIQRLSTIGGTNKTSIAISDYDLFPGKILRISSSIATQYGTTVTSNILTITVPNMASRKTYCGSCQLNTRSTCKKYNGICWSDYTDYSTSNPFNTSLCLKVMASECNKIWINSNPDDPQCLDFKSYYNLTLMKIKPTLTGAKYSSNGKVISLTFSDPIYTADFTDCGPLFPAATLNWLPQSKSGLWLDSTTLQVDYDPQVGIMTQITLNGGVLRYNYAYAQEYVSNSTISITLPVLDSTLKINGLNTISECDSVELFGMLATPSLHKLIFKWDVCYNTSTLDSNKLDEFNKLLSNFAIFNPQGVFCLPSQYIIRGITIKVTLTAKAANFDSNLLTTSTEVYVMDNTPKISFVQKSQSALELDGTKNSSIPLEIFNIKCAKADFGSESNIIPVDVEFLVTSGSTLQDISTQGDAETKIASAINNIYSTYKKLTLGASLGFTYFKFYNITAIIKDKLTGNKNSDNLVVYFAKPPIKCVIDQIGSLVNLFRDIELNGGNSVIPASTGDIIEYKWKCISATILDFSGTCTCPIMDDSDMTNLKLILPKDRMKDMCKYVFSLIVIATQGPFKRSSRNETQFITFKGPIVPLQGVIIKGTHSTIKDLYFTFALPQSDTSVKDNDLAIKWSLVEVKSQVGTSSIQYSMINTFIYDFFTEVLKMTLDSSIKTQDTPLPDTLMPKLLTSNMTRVLAIDQASLLPQYKYTFGATVYYPSAPSIVFVDFFTPKLPRKRDLTITPTSGVGFETPFRISFMLSSSTDVDEAEYQIFRRNCPSYDNETRTALTPLFGRSNTYVVELAPGSKSCEYQVEITVRAYEYDDYIDISTTITVNAPSRQIINVISDQLNKMLKSDMWTVDQRISTLAEISNVNIPEQSSQGQNVTNLIISELSKIDVNTGGVMDIMETKDKVILLSTQSNILASLSVKQAVNIDMKLASTVKSKISDYLVEVQTMEGGSYIIQSALAALSGIANIASTKQFDTDFFSSMQIAMQIMSDMKFKEMPPGAPTQTLASPSIDIVLNKNYISVFDQKQTYSTPKNVSVGLPEGLQQHLMESLELNSRSDILAVNVSNPQAVTSSRGKSKHNDVLKAAITANSNKTITIGSSIKATSFSPFETVKDNAAVNKNFLNNASSSFVSADKIASLYVDIACGRLNNVVNPKNLSTNIMQLNLLPFEFQKNATEKSINAGIGIGALSEGKEATFTFPPFGSIQEYINSSVIVPLYYLADIGKWTNENCSLEQSKPDDIVLKFKCSKIGTKAIKDIHQAFSVTADVINDVLKVIASGNYQQLINVNVFLDTGTRNITAYACVLTIIVVIILVEIYLYKKDKRELYKARCKVLQEKFNQIEIVKRNGTFYEIMAFFCKIKRQGFSKLAKNKDDIVHPVKEKSLGKQKQKKKKIIIKDNGLSKLSNDEEQELRDLYDLFLQVSGVYDEEEIEGIIVGELEYSNVLTRLTKIAIDEEILRQEVTFCTLMKSENLMISAFARPEITTPRTNKFLIVISAIIGELFVTGYFYNTDSTKDPSAELSENSSTYLGNTVIYSIAATLLMVPLKILISIFLVGSMFTEDMTREQIEAIENRASIFLSIGFVAGIMWLGGCLYGILMYVLNFPEDALKTWMTTYFVSFFSETCIIGQLKILFKVIVGLIVFRMARSRILLTFIGVCVGKIVDQIVSLI